ncbi:hypothetical protein H3147_19835 [Streptomyces sp. OF8]|uniref:Uncharacterized protein n=1 Tax=Streptomyces alkaliterrae TaxID=2213162 RepID=A0A5P0YTY4_9ACTN|nr:hypothetical protein [Streptomyces alkaliterrae]MBB1261057.1 hypothetical protein [Streptomyces alkaliterrae]MQS02902.1 hypothetical protein [Streptomyces alkaliterrae]
MVAVPARAGDGVAELAVRTADGEFLRVNTGEAPVPRLLAHLAGDAASNTGADGLDAPSGELDRLTGAFDQAGYLTARPSTTAWAADRRTVWLLGDERITGPLTALLAAAGADPRPTEPAELATLLDEPECPPAPAAVVWCLDGPVPPGLWDAADRLPERGVAWLRCHREGWQAWLEPLAALPGDVTSAHIRARRLAATPAHRELAAYWRGARTTGHPAPLTGPAAALIAALLAADLADWAGAAPGEGGLPARRRLRRVDLRDLTVENHPVLPVPPVAPRRRGTP